MNPITKLIRAMLLLPVKSAEEREQRVKNTVNDVREKRARSEALLLKMERSAEHLRETYDHVLERSQWPS